MNNLQDGIHYREIANKLRAVARGCNFPNVRSGMAKLADEFLPKPVDHAKRLPEPGPRPIEPATAPAPTPTLPQSGPAASRSADGAPR